MNKTQIRKETKKFLKKHAVDHLPIDIFALIEQEGLKIIFEDMEDDHSGFLLVEKGKGTVAINSSHHANRQRFTGAHELGHYILHTQGVDRLFVDKAFRRSAASSTGEDYIEIEANRFAAEILMPEALIKETVGDRPLTDLDIYQLSLDFEVSEQAMTLRLVNLRLIDN